MGKAKIMKQAKAELKTFGEKIKNLNYDRPTCTLKIQNLKRMTGGRYYKVFKTVIKDGLL